MDNDKGVEVTDRRVYLIVGLITLAALFFRLYGIGEQLPLEYEVKMVQGAYDYMESGLMPNVMWWHPPLRNILIYLSTGIFGFGPAGLWFWSLALGAMTVPLLAMLTYEVWGDRRAACISAFLLAFDPLHMTFSRQAIQEAHVAFFSVLGAYLVVMYVKRDSLIYLLLAGAAYGLGLASKLQAGFTLIACWLLIVFPRMVEGERVSGQPLYLRVFAASSALFLLPFAIYLATYLPWLQRGYDIMEWLYMQKVSLGVTSTTVYDIASNPGRAFDWFIRRSAYASMLITDKPHLTFGINNLLLWWLVLPSFGYIAYRYREEKLRSALFVSILFWFSYLPLLVVPTRPIYLLTATSVIPFAFSGVGWVIMDVKERYKIGNGWLYGYLGLLFLSSIFFLPLTYGKALDYPYLEFIVNRFSPH